MQANDIKGLRKRLNITQSELAKLIGVGITTIQNWESGGNIPKTKEKILNDLKDKPATQDFDIGSAIKKIEAISEVTLSAVSELLAKANGGSTTSVLRSLEALVNERVNKRE